MTAKSRSNLKAAFQTGDTPDGDDFADLIDSFANLQETSAQTLAGNVTVDQLTATVVSAGTINATDAVLTSARTVSLSVSGLSRHLNPYVNAYADVTAITSIEATAAWVTVSAALSVDSGSGFSVSGHDVTYTGAVTAKFMVNAAIEARGSANQQLWIAVAKNGSPVSATISKGRNISLDIATRTTQGVVELKTNDIIGMQVRVPDGPIASPEVFGVKYILTPIYWG